MQDDRVKDQGRGQKVSDRNIKNREIVDDGMHPLNQNVGNENKKPDNAQEKNASDYFRSYRGNTLTVVFHALLSPHFKFDQSEGDKIFMRFGGTMFGRFNDDVVEVFPER